jgi:hypothetical protein
MASGMSKWATWLRRLNEAPLGRRSQKGRKMKFMLMMNAPPGDGDWSVKNWTMDELKQHVGFMK